MMKRWKKNTGLVFLLLMVMSVTGYVSAAEKLASDTEPPPAAGVQDVAYRDEINVRIAAENKSKIYRDDDPEFTVKVTGLPEGEALDYTVSRTPGEDVGTYIIVAAVEPKPNYNFEIVEGTLEIIKRPITLTNTQLCKTYGDLEPDMQMSVKVPDVIEEKHMEEIQYEAKRKEGENADIYPVTVTLGENPNYDITVEEITFEIKKKDAKIIPDYKNQIYGEQSPELTVAVTGLLPDDTLNYTLSRTPGTDVGRYVISADMGANPNYEITADTGVYEISKRPVTLSDADAFKFYGDPDPDLKECVAVPEEIKERNLTPIQYEVNRSSGETVDTYPVTVTLGENLNYNITVENIFFRIQKKDVWIITKDCSKIYGETDPVLMAETPGVVGDDALNYELSREAGEDAGRYEISVKIGQNPNYNLRTGKSGELTIIPAPLKVAADDKTMSYGTKEPSLTAQVTGLKQNDAADDVVQYQLSREEGTNAGTYKITPKITDHSKNYVVTPVQGTFTVLPSTVPVRVTVDNQSKVYGTTLSLL